MTSIKELKKDAKVRLTGSYFKLLIIYLIYSVIIFAFTILSTYIKPDIAKVIYLIFLLAFMVPLTFGLMSCIIDTIRGKKVPITDFINVGLKNIGTTWKVYFRIILKLLIPIILTIASMVFLMASIMQIAYSGNASNYFLPSVIFCIISMLLFLITNLYYSFSFFILKDKPNQTGKEIVKMSRDLVKGNLGKYILLFFSFIGWYLLIFVVCYIIQYFLPSIVVTLVSNLGTLLLFPYITATILGFYEDIFYDKTHSEETM